METVDICAARKKSTPSRMPTVHAQSSYGSVVRKISLFPMVVLPWVLLSGCGGPAPDAHATCEELDQVLNELDLSWPVGASGFTLEKAEALLGGFRARADGAPADLGAVLRIWARHFERAIPDLVAQDHAAYLRETDADEREVFLHANIQLARLCGWS
jgi:hypothetical protein